MSGSGQPIVQARISQIRRVADLPAILNPVERKRINKFKEKIKEDDEKGAQYLLSRSSPEAEIEMLRVAVNSRKNRLITDLLHLATNRQEDSVDTTDHRQPMGSKDFFQNAVLYSTLNDDPETLEAVLEWGTNNNQEASKQNRSLLIALLENYNQCISLLYRFGYRIILPDEDEKSIESELTMNNAVGSDIHFYDSFTKPNDYRTCSSHKGVREDSVEDDPVERFLRFKASSNPLYLSTEFIENVDILLMKKQQEKIKLVDPIRKSFALVWYSKQLSNLHTQHSEEYLEISKKCEYFAQDVLEQCDNTKEVKFLLEYSPDDFADEHNENTNWHLALREGHKKFVAHHYFQSYVWEKITGKNFNWDNYSLFWRILYLPLAILLFCFVPLVVLLDSIFRKSDILFVSPQMLNERKKLGEQSINESSIKSRQTVLLDVSEVEKSAMNQNKNLKVSEKESQIFSFFRERIHRPIFRMFVYHFLEMVFLVSLGLSMYDPKDQSSKAELWYYDYMTVIFVVSFFFEDLIDIFGRYRNFFSSFWNAYSLLNHTLFMLGGCLELYGFNQIVGDNRAIVSGNHVVNVGATFVSIAASMSFFSTVRFLLLHRKLGPVVVCIIRVLKDTAIIFVLFFIVYVSFAIGTFSMFKPFTLSHNNITENGFKMKADDLANVKELFSAMFWRLFDPGENDLASIIKIQLINGTNIKEDGEVSMQFSHFVGLAFWAVYQAILVILLVNIFIAMMNTTYMKVSQRADLEWKYSKSYYQVQFLSPRAVLPPPFRLIYYYAKLMYRTKSNEALEADRENKTREYITLLHKLVRTKKKSDEENSIQDDFSDLRQDIQNIVSDKQKAMHIEIHELKEMMVGLKNEMRLLNSIASV